MLNWNECKAVERAPDKVSGAWVFVGTRVPVKALFENLEDGATVDEFLEWFPGVDRQQIRDVLEFTGHSLASITAGKTSRSPGSAKGEIWIAPDFDSPLPKNLTDQFEGS
jgi:uncharacterized protein (DUF433 family)